jgi:probable rRNA maturation factor
LAADDTDFRSIYLPPWRIDISRRAGVQKVVALTELARSAVRALEAADATAPASLGLILSDDDELTELNQRHMGEKGPTDVLSFPLQSEGGQVGFALPPGQRVHLGDVVISVERAVEQAREGRGGQTGDVRWSAADEMRLLAVHGTLHVCGWDHATASDERAMREMERRILREER